MNVAVWHDSDLRLQRRDVGSNALSGPGTPNKRRQRRAGDFPWSSQPIIAAGSEARRLAC